MFCLRQTAKQPRVVIRTSVYQQLDGRKFCVERPVNWYVSIRAHTHSCTSESFGLDVGQGSFWTFRLHRQAIPVRNEECILLFVATKKPFISVFNLGTSFSALLSYTITLRDPWTLLQGLVSSVHLQISFTSIAIHRWRLSSQSGLISCWTFLYIIRFASSLLACYHAHIKTLEFFLEVSGCIISVSRLRLSNQTGQIDCWFLMKFNNTSKDVSSTLANMHAYIKILRPGSGLKVVLKTFILHHRTVWGRSWSLGCIPLREKNDRVPNMKS